MDRRILFWTLALVIVLPSVAAARKFTDVAGNQISADYVRVHEGEVILRQGSRIIKCPYDKFSDLDKAYIREQMEAERTKTKRRTGINQIGGPVAAEVAEDNEARELRTWHDLQGRKILAQYTGFSGGLVELIKDGKRITYPYGGFSSSDQFYVAQILISEGREDEIPKEKEESEEGSGEGPPEGENDHGGRGPSRGGFGGPGPMGGGFSPPEPDYEVAGPPNFSPPSIPTPNFGMPSGPGGPNFSGPPIHEPNYETSHAPVNNLGGPRPGFGSPSMMEEVGICSGCNKEVPSHIGAGDRCPHCNIRFDYEEKADGSREYAGGGLSSRQTRGIVRLSILGFLVVMGALGALFRR